MKNGWSGQDCTQRDQLYCALQTIATVTEAFLRASLNDSKGHDANVHVSENHYIRAKLVRNMFSCDNQGIHFTFKIRSLKIGNPLAGAKSDQSDLSVYCFTGFSL